MLNNVSKVADTSERSEPHNVPHQQTQQLNCEWNHLLVCIRGERLCQQSSVHVGKGLPQ